MLILTCFRILRGLNLSHFSRKRVIGLAVTILATSSYLFAQNSSGPNANPTFCTRDESIQTIRQQIDATKTFDDAVQRIAVLVRAADMLWLYDQQRSRLAFTEAFELGVQNFKDKGDKPKIKDSILVETPDQRFLVIQAVAKHDPVWARKLTEDLLKKDRSEGEEATKHVEADVRTATKILNSAILLLSSDVNAAINFATVSLSYPASLQLTRFLYKLADVNPKAADEFYRKALSVYGNKPLREFLYLAAYPFGINDAGDMPEFGQYVVPNNFTPNVSLQRLFVQTLLLRAQSVLENPPDERDNYNFSSGTTHLLEALIQVEPLVRRSHPDLITNVEQAHTNLLNALSQEDKEIFLRSKSHQDLPLPTSFDEKIEAAEKEPNVNKRDELIVTAILNAGPTESLDHLVNVADKISYKNLRQQLLDWLYFDRAQTALKEKRLDEATKLAMKVEEFDQRAYLYSEIAKESLKKVEDQNQARELLENIVTTVKKGPNTTTAARALLSAAYLYLPVDASRSISILGEAVRCINQIESPDFTAQFALRRLEGKNFGRFASFKTPGFNIENVFRQIAQVDFNNALAQINSLQDKSLRTMTTLALAEFCLQRAYQQEKVKKPRRS